LRQLTEYLARTCFPEIAVPEATADLVDVAATASRGCRSAGRSPTEPAARQNAFWEMHDALFADQGRLEDVWPRAERLGLDVERCEADRRSDAVRDRVRDEFRCGVKAGVATTPTLFAAGERHTSPLDLAALERLIQQPS
jgi:2-hydroxychromene-2-carboxylate isomerase